MDEVEIQVRKAQLWEEACGKLRALAAVEGYRSLCDGMSFDRRAEFAERWEAVNSAVEDFIKEFKNEGFQE